MYSKTRLIVLPLLLAFLLLLQSMAFAADLVTFRDPGAGDLAVASFDWLPASSLSDDAVPLSTDLAAPTQFQQLFQAKLGNLVDGDDTPFYGAGVATGQYEITVVASYGQLGYREEINTDADAFIEAERATLGLDDSANENYMRMYLDTNLNADSLSGTGYDDGVLLMSGVVSSATGTFVTRLDENGDNTLDISDLDQRLDNNYPGIGTVTGEGSSVIIVTIDPASINRDYFPDTESNILQVFLNTSLVLPFQQVNPSQKVVGELPQYGQPFGPYSSVNGLPSLVATEQVDFLFQADANSTMVLDLIQDAGLCRMTGGSVTENFFFDSEGVERVYYSYVEGTYADATPDVNGKINKNKIPEGATWVTTGGQIGAPSVDPASGHWEHTQHAGAEGNFTFLAGTASAPPGTEISNINCADEGWCVQARCAPFKQIFWDGIGYFPNKHEGDNFNAAFPDTTCTVTTGGPQKDGTLHYFKAMVGDFGENDRKNRQPDNTECTWVPPSSYDVDNHTPIDAVYDAQFGYKGGQVCSKCADYYQIQIYCGSTEATKGEVIYTFEDFIDGGNFQIHPETGEHCTADLF